MNETPTSPSTPALTPEERRTWRLLCHVSALAAFVFPLGNILGPLTVWLMKRDDPEIDQHGKASLNFQVTVMIAVAIAMLTIFLILFFFVFTNIGAQPKASSGGQAFGTIMALFLGLGSASAIMIYAAVQLVINAVRAYEGKAPEYRPTFNFLK